MSNVVPGFLHAMLLIFLLLIINMFLLVFQVIAESLINILNLYVIHQWIPFMIMHCSRKIFNIRVMEIIQTWHPFWTSTASKKHTINCRYILSSRLKTVRTPEIYRYFDSFSIQDTYILLLRNLPVDIRKRKKNNTSFFALSLVRLIWGQNERRNSLLCTPTSFVCCAQSIF